MDNAGAEEVSVASERSLVAPHAALTAELRGVEDLAAAFLLGQGPATVAAYRRDLTDFGQFLAGIGVEALAVRRAHVDAYAHRLRGLGASDATVARRLACLSGFYRYALEEGLLERNPVVGVRRPRLSENSQALGLGREQTRALLTAADAASARDRALLYLLVFLGLRISEAIGVDVEDLEATRGHQTVWVSRKRERRSQLVLAPPAAIAVAAVPEGRELGPLLVTGSGRRLDRHHAAKIVGRLARRAGLEPKVTPHALRHAFITHALDAGVALREVQDAAGHADPRTTRRYDRARGSLDRHPGYALASYLAE